MDPERNTAVTGAISSATARVMIERSGDAATAPRDWRTQNE